MLVRINFLAGTVVVIFLLRNLVQVCSHSVPL